MLAIDASKVFWGDGIELSCSFRSRQFESRGRVGVEGERGQQGRRGMFQKHGGFDRPAGRFDEPVVQSRNSLPGGDLRFCASRHGVECRNAACVSQAFFASKLGRQTGPGGVAVNGRTVP